MNLAIGLSALTVLATTAGGFLAIKSRDRLHLVLGLSAGLLLGLVAFDLLPEVFELNTILSETYPLFHWHLWPAFYFYILLSKFLDHMNQLNQITDTSMTIR